MDKIATRQLDAQALEQILVGHVLAVTGEANQIFRMRTQFDDGIDGEIEFKNNDGKASGKKIYLQLNSGNLRTRNSGKMVFDVHIERQLNFWLNQPADVYLVIRQTNERRGEPKIQWMNVTRYVKSRKNPNSRQIVFTGEDLTMESVWRVRDEFFPHKREKKR
jgi:hypothetical protein